MSNYCQKGHWEDGMKLPCKQCQIDNLSAQVSRLTAELAEVKAAATEVADYNLELLKELAELRSQEPVILVKQNAAGQIYMVAGDGSSFQLIKHVGASFYARPVPAAQAVPDGGQS